MKVSFDFDGTLTKQEVQDFARSLILKGVNVFVVTARFNEMKKGFYKPNPTNDDLWEVCKKVGIPERNVIFCNMEDKSHYLIDTNIKFHLDDCWVTIKEIEANTEGIPVIDVNSKDWKKQCKSIIKEYCKVDEIYTRKQVLDIFYSWLNTDDDTKLFEDFMN